MDGHSHRARLISRDRMIDEDCAEPQDDYGEVMRFSTNIVKREH